MNKNIINFIGCDAEYDVATTVLFGAPYDGTTSFRPGARFGCSAIRNESFGIETYSPYQNADLTDIAVFDSGDIETPFGSPEPALKMIKQRTSEILAAHKRPVMLGGEHLVSLPAISACSEQNSDLRVLHFDAHADLRSSYLEQELTHAGVIKQCADLLGDNKIYQFGIRSGCREEFLWGQGKVTTELFHCATFKNVVQSIKQHPIYLTIDLDVLDPSCFCGTGTPEAGGLSFVQLLECILQLKGLNIVGADIVELSPHYDQSGASTALACKLLRELLLVMN